MRFYERLRRTVVRAAVIGFAAVSWPAYTADAQISPTRATCEQLLAQRLTNVTITSATVVGAAADVPASCRVAATLTPTGDSDIKVEVWMPMTGWNGKFHSAGGANGANSAVGGSINIRPMQTALRQGYATAGTDGGHQGATLSFAPAHPEKLVDFGYRAVHEMTITAKSLIAAFYGTGPRYSYWNACAAGGRQGWQEVQRYPADYDGLVVSDPANAWTHLQSWSLWVWQAAHASETSYIPPAKYPVIHAAVLNACDALDGTRDGLLENPTACRFDPGVLQCKGDDDTSCLTSRQVETARTIYAPARNPRTGEEIFPGLLPGSELNWGNLAGPTPPYYATETYKYLVFGDPAWSPATRPINFDTDVAQADARAGVLNAINPNVKPFFDRGGKIISYAGWTDPLISPLNDVNFYTRVAAAAAPGTADASIRLFMVPGMNHCGGGEGPDRFDMLTALEQWVEQGKAPTRIEASRVVDGQVQRTRPLCPYPQLARYSGQGSIDEAANFMCSAPPTANAPGSP
jgi:feruloyl esterase